MQIMTHNRFEYYMAVAKFFPDALYINHTNSFNQNLLKPWYQLTVSHPVYRRRFMSDNFRETIIDIDCKGITNEALSLRYCRRVMRNARKAYGITCSFWWTGISGTGIHLHLFHNHMPFDIEPVLVEGIPQSREGIVGYDHQVLTNPKTLIRPFGSYHTAANHYKSLIKAKEVIGMKQFVMVTDVKNIIYPSEVKLCRI